MKIFWSWQSDTPGKTGRHFIRQALQEAIDHFRAAVDVEEITKQEARESMHLDSDIQNVRGSPDLARTIFAKIDSSAVVVADVTLVGSTIERTGRDPKKLMNSNVAIELGYALHAHTDSNVIMVLNIAYGKHEELPFDLRHKGGIVRFDLPDGVDAKHMKEQHQMLRSGLIKALEPFLSAPAPSALFAETPIGSSRAIYFLHGTFPVTEGPPGPDQTRYGFTSTIACYMRFIPSRPLTAEISLANLKATASHAPIFGTPDVTSFSTDSSGAVRYGLRAGRLVSLTKLFENGEIWAVTSEAVVTDVERLARYGSPTAVMAPRVFQRECYDMLHSLATFAIKERGQSKWNIEIGITGAIGLRIYNRTTETDPGNTFTDPIHKQDIFHRQVVDVGESEQLNVILLTFFDKIYDAAGTERPPQQFGFPPNRPIA